VEFLARAGFDADAASSIEDAIGLVREARPHAVTVLVSSTFNDSVAGGIDELLREQPRPNLMLTCTRYGSSCVIYENLPCGEYLGCLRKPYDFVPTMLRARIQAAIEQRS
jgi:hypothetical protein